MNFAKLIIFQPGHATRKVEIVDDQISLGRALDNTVSLDGDTNISRYHAEIEKRGDDYYLVDLNSSNGTTVNDEVIDETVLRNEDLICLGDSTLIEFYESDSPWQSPNQDASKNESPAVVASSTPVEPALPVAQISSPASEPVIQNPVKAIDSGRRQSLLPIALGVGGGILLIGIIAVLIYTFISPKCKPSARIVNPAVGTTISELTTIRVEVKNQECIDRLIYQIDGQKLMSAENPPYEITLDPKGFQNLDPGTHHLSVVVEDKDQKQVLQPGYLVIAFETSTASESETPPPDSATEATAADTSGAAGPDAVSVTEVRELCIQLAKQFSSSKTNYRYDMEFLSQVQSRTSEYARQGFSGRARRFRDIINTNFIDQKGLDDPLGYVLAMSRSSFVLPAGQGRSEESSQGLWHMSQSFAQRIGYSGLCGAETISDPSQRCAALVAASYAKDLVTVTFKGDFVYGVACFSMNPKEAEAWATKLPPDRSDFWKTIRSPEQRDRVVRFFAAGIVAENPEKFNLPQDRKLSSLYPKK